MASPVTLLIDEVKAQVEDLLSSLLDSDQIHDKQWPDPKVDRFAHDLVVTRFGNVTREAASNVQDRVGYTIVVVIVTQGDQPDVTGDRLSDWANKVQERLGHAADGPSPLSKDPLPLTSPARLQDEDACFTRMAYGPTTQVTAPTADGAFRGSVGIPMVVTLAQVAHKD